MDGRVVRVVAVEERMQLHPEELRVLEKFLCLGKVAGQPWVRPYKAVHAWDRLHHLAYVCVVRVEDDPRADVMLLHQRHQPVAVERDAEHRLERADVHVRVEDHASSTAALACEISASAASSPAPRSSCAPRSRSVRPTA